MAQLPASSPTGPSASSPRVREARFARFVAVALLIFLVFLLPLAVGFEVPGDNAAESAAPHAMLGSAHAAVMRALSFVGARSGIFAPAVLMGAAAAVANLGASFRLPEWLQWAVGLSMLAAACSLSGRDAAWLSLLDRGGVGRGSTGSRAAFAAGDVLLVDAFAAALGEGLNSTTAAAPLVAWATHWQRAMASDGGASHKLLVFSEAGSTRLSTALLPAARRLLAHPEGLLEINAAIECGDGSCATRVEAHVARVSRANEHALVVMRHVDACATDAVYDDLLAVVERFLDETPAVQTTASGEVRKALVGFLLLAPSLPRDACERYEALGTAAPAALVHSGTVEELWPRSAFTKAVQTARRAFINRLGSDLAVVC